MSNLHSPVLLSLSRVQLAFETRDSRLTQVSKGESLLMKDEWNKGERRVIHPNIKCDAF